MTEHPLRDHDDLPILSEIGQDLNAAFAREQRAAGARRRRRRVRRFGAAFAALLVLVPGAVATRSIWAPTPDSVDPRRPFQDSRAVVVAEGTAEEEGWRLSARASGKELCLQLSAFTSSDAIQQASCSRDVPARRQIDLQLTGRRDGFVFGQVGPAVTKVEIEVSGRPRISVEVRRPSPDAIRRGGLPADLRFYVAAMPEPVSYDDRVSVVALDAAGRALGRAGAR